MFILNNFYMFFINFTISGIIIPAQVYPLYFSYTLHIFTFIVVMFFIFDTKVKRVYAKYSKITNSSTYTGSNVVKKLLQEFNLNNINVISISESFEKKLSKEDQNRFDKAFIDHYDPRTKTVALSSSIFYSDSITAVAVATHKVSYAIWYNEKIIISKLRSFLYLITSMSYIAGLILGVFIGIPGRLLESTFFFNLMDFGLILYGIGFLLGILNLPIEFYISRKALKLLEENNLLQKDEIKLVKKVLNNIPFIFLMGGGPPELKRLKIYLKKVK